MCYLALLSGSQNSCQLNMRRISTVCHIEYAISTIYITYLLYLCVYIYIFTFITVCL